jgi:hypothetical protein
MLPYLYEFHWTAGHLIFLGIFGSVAVTIFGCVALAAVRAARATPTPAAAVATTQASSELRGSEARARS